MTVSWSPSGRFSAVLYAGLLCTELIRQPQGMRNVLQTWPFLIPLDAVVLGAWRLRLCTAMFLLKAHRIYYIITFPVIL